MNTEIPVLDHPDQEFHVRSGDKDIKIKLLFNPSSNRWTFDLWINEKLMLAGRKLVAGIDLIAPYSFNIGHLYVIDTRANNNEPSRYNLPRGDVRLIHSDVDL